MSALPYDHYDIWPKFQAPLQQEVDLYSFVTFSLDILEPQ